MRSKGKQETPVWWEWRTNDDEGFVNGVSDDAPENIKKAYEEFLADRKNNMKKGIKE